MLNRKGPILSHDNDWSHFTQPTLQKWNSFGYNVLPHLSYLPDLSPHSYHFFKHLGNFCRDAPTTSMTQKCFLHGFLRYKNTQTFLLGKKVLIVIVLTLINKDVFEPSYNDLKFTVPNCNYVCTNLIVYLLCTPCPPEILQACSLL